MIDQRLLPGEFVIAEFDSKEVSVAHPHPGKRRFYAHRKSNTRLPRDPARFSETWQVFLHISSGRIYTSALPPR